MSGLGSKAPRTNTAPDGISRPILFSASMVRALLADTKSQTRRIVKPRPTGEPRPLSEWSAGLAHACHDHSPDPDKLHAHSERLRGRIFPFTSDSGGLYSPSCPYGRPSDLLWVRETHYVWSAGYKDGRGRHISYRASEPDAPCTWTPSIHMPRWASRLTLRITDVRIERLQDISDEDAEAEGWPGPDENNSIASAYPIAWYSQLWESINGADSWASNPWVWVVSFERTLP